MKFSLLFNRKCYLKTALGLPLLGLLAFTGCASFDGTTDNHNLTNNKVATYMNQSQEAQPADSDSDPGLRKYTGKAAEACAHSAHPRNWYILNRGGWRCRL